MKLLIKECDCHPNKSWGPFKLFDYKGEGDMPPMAWVGIVLVVLGRPWRGFADKGIYLKVGRNHLIIFTPLPRARIV